jgi:hypothetical protein
MVNTRSISAYIFLIALAVPSMASANDFLPSFFTYDADYNYGRVYVAEYDGGLVEGEKSYSDEDSRIARLNGYPIVGGSLFFTSGLFVSRTQEDVFGHPKVHDVFEPGGSVLADWIIQLPDASRREIEFSADFIGPWDFVYGPGGGNHGPFPFVHGLLNPDDAAFLGVPARWLKGDLTIYTDELRDSSRGPGTVGFALYGHLDTYDVPEPATLALGLIACGGWYLRRRRIAFRCQP